MSRGHPDYNVADISFFSVDNPNSDVIAERSGFARLDNRGRVIWFDDFRQGLHRWTPQSNATGSDPVHVYDDELSVGFHGSILFDPVGNNGTSQIDTNLVLPVAQRLGIEVSLRLISNMPEINVVLEHAYTQGNYHYGQFSIEQGTGNIYKGTIGGGDLLFSPPSAGYLVNSWISMKLVLDFENDAYFRFLLGNQQYDLSGSLTVSAGTGLSGYTGIIIRSTGYNPDDFEPFYLGYVVISGDEP
jgi:hypothetical protein